MRLPTLTFVLLLTVAGCSQESKSNDEKEGTKAACKEPANPYHAGSGHYAGYEWAENHGGGDCNGRSDSFNEGCEEFEQQEADYQECEAKKNR